MKTYATFPAGDKEPCLYYKQAYKEAKRTDGRECHYHTKKVPVSYINYVFLRDGKIYLRRINSKVSIIIHNEETDGKGSVPNAKEICDALDNWQYQQDVRGWWTGKFPDQPESGVNNIPPVHFIMPNVGGYGPPN